jgi:hypothetical protein
MDKKEFTTKIRGTVSAEQPSAGSRSARVLWCKQPRLSVNWHREWSVDRIPASISFALSTGGVCTENSFAFCRGVTAQLPPGVANSASLGNSDVGSATAPVGSRTLRQGSRTQRQKTLNCQFTSKPSPHLNCKSPIATTSVHGWKSKLPLIRRLTPLAGVLFMSEKL